MEGNDQKLKDWIEGIELALKEAESDETISYEGAFE